MIFVFTHLLKCTYTLVGKYILTFTVYRVVFYFRYIVFMTLAIMALCIIPYTIFFYEEDDTEVMVSVCE